MRRIQRIVMLTTLVVLAPVLSGCENFDMDKLDVFGLNEKKKLPGERKPVFPEGVPGVTQGIPPEFVVGNQPPPDTAQTAPAAAAAEPASKTAAVEPAAEPKPKPKPKSKPKTAAAPAQITVQPAGQDAGQPQQQAPWPEPAQQPAAQGTAPWPSAPAPGTFSR
jgi:hypothetical protein